jgi:hypothetical protein
VGIERCIATKGRKIHASCPASPFHPSAGEYRLDDAIMPIQRPEGGTPEPSHVPAESQDDRHRLCRRHEVKLQDRIE